MFCVYDDKKNIIALHDECEVVESYLDSLQKSHPNEDLSYLSIGKIKKKKLKKVIDLDSLYLVRFADTYVQSKYLEYIELSSHQCLYDERQCKDVLLRILEFNSLSDKERKTLEKAVEIVDGILKESKEFTPSLSELTQYEETYAPYIYNTKYI